MENKIYSETQKMMPGWFGVVLLVIFVFAEIVLICNYVGIILGTQMPLAVLIVITILLVLMAYLALFLKLNVTVTVDELRIRTLGTRIIKRKDILRCEISEKVKPISQYGGWGVRHCLKKQGYICPGNNGGVMIHIAGKKDTLITSKTPQDLMNALMR